MQVLEHGARRQLQAARGQLVGELSRIGRQIPVGPQLDPLIP